jgi:endoglucanase
MRFRLTIILATLATLAVAPAAHAYYSGNATPGNPLAGHLWYVDKQRGSWWLALQTSPKAAAPLAAFADNPMGKTFGSFVSDPQIQVAQYIQRAEKEEPGSIPFLNLGRIDDTSCPYPPTPAGFSESDIDNWVNLFSQGIGNARVMIIVETDRLTTIGCLPRWAQQRRYRELSYEVHTLHVNNPNSIVYIDAGSQDWGKNAWTMAQRLRLADVAEAQGFALGASHHDLTSLEVKFGLQISKLLGGKHFVVNTDSNGWGDKAHGHTEFSRFFHGGCTPPGEGLGIQPTVDTGSPYVDAFVWAGTPGFEGGSCLGYGQNSPYTFYLPLAVSLAQHANPTAAEASKYEHARDAAVTRPGL